MLNLLSIFSLKCLTLLGQFHIVLFYVLLFHILQFHVLHFHVLSFGPSFSCPAFSAPPVRARATPRGEARPMDHGGGNDKGHNKT